ncbi:MAG: hypothetical protein GY839_10310 [candidate division Zixibacteria bacterium]|nr:hypothetical protein [candidate division Zixibacteria bacterium]
MKKFCFILTCFIILTFALNTEVQSNLSEFGMPNMPISFTENMGQFGETTLFKAEANGVAFYFSRDEVAYLFVRKTDVPIEDELSVDKSLSDELKQLRYKQELLLIKAKFIGANEQAEVSGEGIQNYKYNYFRGNDQSKWQTNVPSYSSIVYHDIYPGIDLKYYGNDKSLKYDFIIKPGADVSQIQIRYDGIDNLGVTPSGDLEINTSFGEMHEKAPRIYQDMNGLKTEVSGRYELKEPGVFGFAFDESFNPEITLIIDPELAYSTFLGGSYHEYCNGIELDENGNMYIAGHTGSDDFPVVNPYDSSANGSGDIFVSKISSDGQTLLFSTFIGGGNAEHCYDVVINSLGDICLTGKTQSSDYPMAYPYQSIYDDGDVSSYGDAYITVLSSSGDSLVFSSYLGGNREDIGYGIAVNDYNDIYIIGFTKSNDFPTVNAFDDTRNGYNDAFVSKFSPYTGGSECLLISTYLGGSDTEKGNAIEIDGDENIYLVGETDSDDFPVSSDAFDTTFANDDIFITKMPPDLDSLMYSTYLGGLDDDHGYSIAVDNNGCAYLTGYTNSTDFPLVTPYDSTRVNREAFISKLSAAGDSLLYSTFLGGEHRDNGKKIAVDESGLVYITGQTQSNYYPLVNCDNPGFYNGSIILSVLSTPTNTLCFSGRFGGSDSESGTDMVFADNGDLLITGLTKSPDFPLLNPVDDEIIEDYYDAFVSRFNFESWEQVSGVITGVITDEYANPVEGVFVEVQGTFNNDISNADGEYLIEGNILSASTVFFSHIDFCDSAIYNIEVNENETTYVNVELAMNGSVNGIVYNNALDPLEGAVISAFCTEYESVSDTTDSFGQYLLSGFCAGNYDLSLTRYGCRDSTINDIAISAGDTTTLDIEITVLGSIAGYVTDPDGEPIPGVRVKYRSYPDPIQFAAYTNQHGFYQTNGIEPGTYNGVVYHNNNYIDTTCDVNIFLEDTTVINVTLQPVTEYDVTVWIGNLDESPLIAPIGQQIEFNVYFQTQEDVEVADMHYSLAINNAFIDSFLVDNFQIHYPLSYWDSKSFGNPEEDYVTDDSGYTWDSYMFVGFAELMPPYNSPLLHTEPGDPPILGLTYAVKITDNHEISGLITDNALMPGCHSIYGPTWMGDPQGGDGYSYEQIISTMHLLVFHYFPGDANMAKGFWPPEVIGADATYLANFFRSVNSPCLLGAFYASADINGDCLVIGSDVTRFVHFFRGEVEMSYCPDYPSAWPTPDDLPEEAPTGWPNCE